MESKWSKTTIIIINHGTDCIQLAVRLVELAHTNSEVAIQDQANQVGKQVLAGWALHKCWPVLCPFGECLCHRCQCSPILVGSRNQPRSSDHQDRVHRESVQKIMVKSETADSIGNCNQWSTEQRRWWFGTWWSRNNKIYTNFWYNWILIQLAFHLGTLYIDYSATSWVGTSKLGRETQLVKWNDLGALTGLSLLPREWISLRSWQHSGLSHATKRIGSCRKADEGEEEQLILIHRLLCSPTPWLGVPPFACGHHISLNI